MLSRRFPLALAVSALLPGFAFAQSAAAPSGGVVTSPGSVTSTAGGAESALLPEEAPALEKPEKESRPKAEGAATTTKTEAFEQNLKQRIRFRQIRTLAQSDASVKAEWDRSIVARTDLQKREALKKYYTLLFTKMSKLDPSLQPLIDTERTLAQDSLTQSRMSPTDTGNRGERSRRAMVFAD